LLHIAGSLAHRLADEHNPGAIRHYYFFRAPKPSWLGFYETMPEIMQEQFLLSANNDTEGQHLTANFSTVPIKMEDCSVKMFRKPV
jgi:hypothetical protein